MPLCSNRPYTQTIRANPAAIAAVTDRVGEWLETNRWPKDDVFAVQLAVQEALANAIRHGCRGDANQQVRCSVSCDNAGGVVVVVQDPGSGFDPAAIADPLDGANILRPGGRGILLINELMDEVQFTDGGREVRMRKRSSRAGQHDGG